MRLPKLMPTRMRLLLLSFTTLALFSLSNCGTPGTPVNVPDVELYFQKGNASLPSSFSDYILDEHFLTSGQYILTKNQWDQMSQGMVSMSLDDWDKINIMVADMCSQLSCDYQTLARLKQLSEKFHSANEAR